MPRKAALFLHLFSLVLKPMARQTSALPNQFIAHPQHPLVHDSEAWCAYWKAQGQPWRTEPEIDIKRQEMLIQHRETMPDTKKGIYPFRGAKLTRADVEWLLITHENGRGPVEWSDKTQRGREGLDLRGADLRKVDLHGLPLACSRGGLTRSEWKYATLEQRSMAELHLEGTNLSSAHLERAYLARAHMQMTNLQSAYMEGADLYRTHLEGAYFYKSNLGGTSLGNVYFDTATNINDVTLKSETFGFAFLADIHWGATNLSLVNWVQLKMIGEEFRAHQSKRRTGKNKKKEERLRDYQTALRGTRQLVVVLQDQGLNEDASYFAYRAQRLQRIVVRRQRKFGQYLFSLFLDLLAGYGYKPRRSLIVYIVTILGFMGLYLLNAHFAAPHLTWDEALVLSISSFHGRGFFPQNVTLGDTYARLAAAEAVVGLLVEISFIATFTQRFFGK